MVFERLLCGVHLRQPSGCCWPIAAGPCEFYLRHGSPVTIGMVINIGFG